MTKQSHNWKPGRGKLGVLAPLLGTWRARADSPQGPVTCTRTFVKVLDGTFIQLTAHWKIKSKHYDEIALFGIDADGTLSFWSFTSDGKHSRGQRARANDIPPQAIAFEADVPAGRARMAYFPDDTQGFHWIVEAKTKKGWKRFLDHHYLPIRKEASK